MRTVPCSRCGALFEPQANEHGVTSYVCSKHDDSAQPAAAAPKKTKKGGLPHALRLTSAEAKTANIGRTKPRP